MVYYVLYSHSLLLTYLFSNTQVLDVSLLDDGGSLQMAACVAMTEIWW